MSSKEQITPVISNIVAWIKIILFYPLLATPIGWILFPEATVTYFHYLSLQISPEKTVKIFSDNLDSAIEYIEREELR